MKIVVQEHVERTVTVAIADRLDAFNAGDIRSQLDQYMADGVKRFVIDLSQTPFMDSAGMAVLVSLLRRCRQAGGDVKLVWPKFEPVRRVLQLTQFDRIFEFVESAP